MKNAKNTYTPGFQVVDPDLDMGFTEQGFQAAASLERGVNGVAKIDTTFENTSEEEVTRPRSTIQNGDATHQHPAPTDQDLWKYPQRRY